MTNEEEKKVYPIYNPTNIWLEKKHIQAILNQTDIKNKIGDLSIYQKAFVHISYSKNSKKNKKFLYSNNQNPNNVIIGTVDNPNPTRMGGNSDSDNEHDYNDCLPIQNESNERLEWLGDGILQSVIASYLWKRYPKQDEGFLTKTRSKLVKTESLARLAKHYGLEKYIIMSQYVEQACNGRANSHILEDTFEALIGALYVDFGSKNESAGYTICHKFIINTIEAVVDLTDLILYDDNYKDQLMRFYQKNFNGKYPIYTEELRNEENKSFQMYVTHPVTNKIVGRGKAQSKKKAEQLSAKQALSYFNI